MRYWIAALFLCSGLAALRFAVYQSRRIGKHSLWFFFYGAALMWLASYMALGADV